MQRHKDLLFLVITINLQVWLGTLEDTSPDRRIKLLLKKEEKKKKEMSVSVKHTTIFRGILEL